MASAIGSVVNCSEFLHPCIHILTFCVTVVHAFSCTPAFCLCNPVLCCALCVQGSWCLVNTTGCPNVALTYVDSAGRNISYDICSPQATRTRTLSGCLCQPVWTVQSAAKGHWIQETNAATSAASYDVSGNVSQITGGMCNLTSNAPGDCTQPVAKLDVRQSQLNCKQAGAASMQCSRM